MTPKVRVVVVNYNGGQLTLECLRSLCRTDWPSDAFEVVLVDNASTDDVIEQTRKELPTVQVITSRTNVGYGGGCNLALTDLGGIDYAALVNNDVVVPPDWLRPLIQTLDGDPQVGAACPKILFRDLHREITIRADATAERLDPRTRGVRVSGARVGGVDVWKRTRCRDGFWGPEYAEGETVSQWTGNGAVATVLMPALDGESELLLAANRPVRATLATDVASREVVPPLLPMSNWYSVPKNASAVDVIQNVGIDLVADCYGADRGYLEIDRGQYDEPTDVFAWCGAAVLLATSYLSDVGLFDERLFLYYEDVELAWRGRARGWRYRTSPQSVVRHVHSAATSNDALRTAELNERNHLLVLARHGSRADTARALWHYARATASYARRDIASPVARGEPPRTATVAMRLRALWGFTRRARRFRRR
jgi:GT2 family glycosyltransferase